MLSMLQVKNRIADKLLPRQAGSASAPEVKHRTKPVCFHCGTACITEIRSADKTFCCEGCELVYSILNNNGLCDYYELQDHPGLRQVKPIRQDKYSYLDNEEITRPLFSFTDGDHAIIKFYIPAIHCASCMWLLEHMPRLNEGISESRLNFSEKEVTIHFQTSIVSLRQLVELMATIGYEPYISLDATDKKKGNKFGKAKIYKLGVAGFCFGNIMLLSFPEYLTNNEIEQQYALMFRLLNLLLSIPVFFYSASEFFVSAWSGLKQRILNIDAPIVLALIITYARSIYEIAAGISGGYLDSMSGIVFFMLVGRIVQERTYRSLSFHRDYQSYFPLAVTLITKGSKETKNIKELEIKDVVEIHNDEIIPADCILLSGDARIDYSFVSGESEPVEVSAGNAVYAGGRQKGGLIMLEVTKPVSSSYLTSLWNHKSFKKDKEATNSRASIIHRMSTWFTYILFSLAIATAVYWWVNDPARILPSVSAMLIVACPCALLLAATYTNGNLLRIFSNNGLFLRDATIIEQLGNIDHLVFDKTGTLTTGVTACKFNGEQPDELEKQMIYTAASGSQHPYCKQLASMYSHLEVLPMEYWKETPGKGVEATVNGKRILIGSSSFTGTADTGAAGCIIRLEDKFIEVHLLNDFRSEVDAVIPALCNDYDLSLLSGDNDLQRSRLQQLFGGDQDLLFRQRPGDKLQYVEKLQAAGKKVAMIGDGLNDAGALSQSNVGISLADDINNFTPSCDAILDASRFEKLPGMLKLGRLSGKIINTSFAISIIYNCIGLGISVQGKMNPMIAAILMPLSTLTIVLVSTGVSSMVAWKTGLRTSAPPEM
ncbi:MAG: HAD family hydrolase [Sphingobacteriales bacterium]|nr:MAG: HAD family hydrolase [Sphingobacteriales bacterium]